MLRKIKNSESQHCALSASLITAIFLISLFLRFYGLGAKDFWLDEIYSVSYAANPWNNWNAPLYWILLHFWVKIFGISEFSVRFPGMAFSLFTTVIVYLLGKELFNKRTALLAMMLIGVSSFHLWYAQEARDYSMVLFFGTLSSYLLSLAIKSNSLKHWIWFAVASLAGIYTNYFYIFLMAAQALFIFYRGRFRLNKSWYFFLFIVGAFSFYLPRFLSKFRYVSQGFWIAKPHWQSLNIVLQNYMLGYHGTVLLYSLATFLTSCFLVILLMVAIKKKDMRQSICFCGLLLCVPLCVAFLFSHLFFSIFLNRGFLLLSPYYYILIACAVMELHRGMRDVAAGVLLLTFCSGTYLYFAGYINSSGKFHLGACLKKPVRPIVIFLEKNVEKEDLLSFTNESVMPGFMFYSRRKFLSYYLFVPRILNSDWQRPVQEGPNRVPIHKASALQFKKLWVISHDWERSGKLDENSKEVKQWLDRNFLLVSSREFDGLWIYCYERSDRNRT